MSLIGMREKMVALPPCSFTFETTRCRPRSRLTKFTAGIKNIWVPHSSLPQKARLILQSRGSTIPEPRELSVAQACNTDNVIMIIIEWNFEAGLVKLESATIFNGDQDKIDESVNMDNGP